MPVEQQGHQTTSAGSGQRCAKLCEVVFLTLVAENNSTFSLNQWSRLLRLLKTEAPSLHKLLAHLQVTANTGSEKSDEEDENENKAEDRFQWVQRWRRLLRVIGSFNSLVSLIPLKQVPHDLICFCYSQYTTGCCCLCAFSWHDT